MHSDTFKLQTYCDAFFVVITVRILEVGQRVSLPCDIEALQDDSPLRISWFKDGQEAPNYIAEDVLKRGITTSANSAALF